MAGGSGKLFDVDQKQLLDYTKTLDGGGFKTKDFRTALGTKTAMEEMVNFPTPKTDKEYRKAVMGVAKIVSEKLGNTPVIALQSYIAPAVFSKWQVK
jgi:DNA topoisomerase-1